MTSRSYFRLCPTFVVASSRIGPSTSRTVSVAVPSGSGVGTYVASSAVQLKERPTRAAYIGSVEVVSVSNA
jgi:hypothetical protein